MSTRPFDAPVSRTQNAAPSPAPSSLQDGSLAAPGRSTATTVEWLETDGRGGYAASTPELCPTRRYHGLLVAPGSESAERYVYLARFDECLVEADGPAWPFSVAQYPDLRAPRGDLALESFEHAPHPRAVYRLGRARVAREVLMPRGGERHAVLVRYELLEAGGPCALELRPILPYRRADALTVENDAADLSVSLLEATPRTKPGSKPGFTARPYPDLPAVSLTWSRRAELEADPIWFRNLVFTDDAARGYEGREDEPSPAKLAFLLEPGEAVVIAAATGGPLPHPEEAFDSELRRRRRARSELDGVAKRLDRAADAFLYEQQGSHTRAGVLAGFPWFLEWGRDTFLALPGLTLARGRLDDCAKVLTGALPYLKDGLLPNIFGSTPAESHYGSADAALWFARAVLLYDRAGGQRALIARELQPALESIAEAYFAGTGLGLAVDDEGLLRAGSPELNPTWMDARTPAGPVTPRHGTPVEIAALWYSLVAYLEELAQSKQVKAERKAWRQRAKRAFLERFWLEETGYLADVWRDGVRDEAVRPNAVLAAALELSPLTKAQRARIVAQAEADLLTPRGLRTLAPSDPSYCGRYGGGPEERDGAYHQGTVWPWLLGFFTEAALRSTRPTRARVATLIGHWEGLEEELDRAGLDQLSEVFDGDPPHRPGGSFAQAWNTAEWLRARRMLAERRP